MYLISEENMFLLTVPLLKLSAKKRKSKRLDKIWSAVKKIANSRPRQKRRFFFEISIHIQFSNPSHGNIEMYKMKAKNEYFLDCKLLCACQLVTSWEPLEETKICRESSWGKKLKLYKVANWWIHETPWRESSPELLTAQPLKTNQDNGDKVDQDAMKCFFLRSFLDIGRWKTFVTQN